MYKAASHLIHCKTNLHAGSGDTKYGIIDKMVQRDTITTLPCIYASSLKGALREYFEEGPEKATLAPLADNIFGRKVRTENESTDNSKGNTIFHEAQLIGFPLRSNTKPYFIATSKFILRQFIDKASLFGLDFPGLSGEIDNLPEAEENAPLTLGARIPGLIVEDYENVNNHMAVITGLQALLGMDIILMHENDFTDAASDYNLPVIARNNLENGESKNLWYEQIVPHQTRFVFYTVSIGEDKFSSNIESKTVQIGANSSLGYGYCKISKIQPQ